MKISVLMSTYNGEKYINDQLDSLFKQTRQPDELIIIDDHSLDNTVNVIKHYIHMYSLENRVQLFVNDTNKGWKQNFIEGIQLTSGEIIFFSDQDDIWFYNKIEVEAAILENDGGVSVVVSKETLWTGNKISNEERYTHTKAYKKLVMGPGSDRYLITSPGCTMAIKRAYADHIMPYYLPEWAHDDFFWKMGILDNCLALIEESTILHRVHDGNVSMKKRTYDVTVNTVRLELTICEHLIDYCKEKQCKARNVNYQELIDYLTHKMMGYKVRLHFLLKKKFRDYISLVLIYQDLYRRKRQIVGDFLLVHGYRRNKYSN